MYQQLTKRGSQVKLYHYNTAKFDELLTLSLQKREGSDLGLDYSDDEKYNEHISFFFAPIPRDIPQILNGEHPFWKDDQELFEYIVDVDSLPRDLYFRVVESYEKTDLLFNKQDWSLVTEDALHIKEQYIDERDELETRLGYHGRGLSKLKSALRKVKYNYRKDYANMLKLHREHPDMGMISQYAPTVPHIMIYVKVPVIPESVEMITLGSKNNLSKW